MIFVACANGHVHISDGGSASTKHLSGAKETMAQRPVGSRFCVCCGWVCAGVQQAWERGAAEGLEAFIRQYESLKGIPDRRMYKGSCGACNAHGNALLRWSGQRRSSADGVWCRGDGGIAGAGTLLICCLPAEPQFDALLNRHPWESLCGEWSTVLVTTLSVDFACGQVVERCRIRPWRTAPLTAQKTHINLTGIATGGRLTESRGEVLLETAAPKTVIQRNMALRR